MKTKQQQSSTSSEDFVLKDTHLDMSMGLWHVRITRGKVKTLTLSSIVQLLPANRRHTFDAGAKAAALESEATMMATDFMLASSLVLNTL